MQTFQNKKSLDQILNENGNLNECSVAEKNSFLSVSFPIRLFKFGRVKVMQRVSGFIDNNCFDAYQPVFR